ncbi:FbpB family small basic protein [Salsuginibacillus kocurii]|uniref:FbpB family small basic protein n=1 Tax=Salsuginibacillus kocurii TaxID=427078 RepID=UPI0003801CB8|nr:FbpB family small basic protein [Salsuginibacillus kocurii]
MRKQLRYSFDELVDENKKELENDPALMMEVEDRVEQRQAERIHEKKADKEH